MAGASMKAIKSRMKSVESTMQITKAMELVASSKLRRAKRQEEAVKPFYELLQNTIVDILKSGNEKNAYTSIPDASAATCYIVIAGDRGLAGGYNHNLFRLVKDQLKDGDCILPIGKKSVDFYAKQPYDVLTEEFAIAAEVGIPESHEIGDFVCEAFRKGRFGRTVVAYTAFQSMLSQVPTLLELLPLSKEMFDSEKKAEESVDALHKKLVTETIYEPSASFVLAKIIPQYVSGMLYGAVCEAAASEFAARRSSMSAANKNAGEMIDSLTLRYNRARQAMITQEITEIIAGAEA